MATVKKELSRAALLTLTKQRVCQDIYYKPLAALEAFVLVFSRCYEIPTLAAEAGAGHA